MDGSIWYRVILKPSDVRFTVPTVGACFEDGRALMDTVREVMNEKITVSDIPIVDVVWYSEKWEWYTLNNRRLWVFKELERLGKITYVAMRRIEDVDVLPSELYTEVQMSLLTTKEVGYVSDNFSDRDANNNVSTKNDASVKDEIDLAKDNPQGQVNRQRSRESSVCSENDRSKTNWGRRETESSTKTRGVESVVIKKNNRKEEAFKAWEEKRAQFCKMYNNDESFHQYVASQFADVRRDSVKSFDELSTRSDVSQSSLARHERRLSWKSGLNGYGNFETYRKEFLEKLRSAKKKSLHDLKPYDVGRSRFLRYHSTFSDKASDVSAKDGRRLSLSSQDGCSIEPSTPKRRRRNTYPTPCSFDSDDDAFNTTVTSGFDNLKSISSRYSHDIECISSQNHDSRRQLLTLNVIERRVTSLQLDGFLARTKAQLYSIWEKRRSTYMQNHYFRNSPKALEYKYCCGICFKEFDARVSLEQHSEELMHWGCVQCGRFFASRTSLGQHALSMGHREF